MEIINYQIKVANLKITKERINWAELKVDSEPIICACETLSMDIIGPPTAFVSALRRTILGEMKVKSLYVDYSDIKCSDGGVLIDMIKSRIRLIPVLQTIPDNFVYERTFTNLSDDPIDVIIDDNKYCDKMPLCRLDPGRFLTIKAKVVSGYSYEFGGHILVNTAVARPNAQFKNLLEGLDKMYTEGKLVEMPEQPPSANCSTYTDHNLLIETNGTAAALDIVNRAIEDLISRVNITSVVPFVNENQCFIEIDDSDSIGNILMTVINDLMPNIKFVGYSNKKLARGITLKLMVGDSDDLKEIIATAVKCAQATLAGIKKSINSFK